MERHIHGRHHPNDDDRRDIGHYIRSSAIDDHGVRPEWLGEPVDRFRGVRVQGRKRRENTGLVQRASDLGASLRPRRLQLHPDNKWLRAEQRALLGRLVHSIELFFSFPFSFKRNLVWNVLFPGSELLDWFSLPDIAPHSLINVFNMDGDTFVVVAHDVSVKLILK